MVSRATFVSGHLKVARDTCLGRKAGDPCQRMLYRDASGSSGYASRSGSRRRRAKQPEERALSHAATRQHRAQSVNRCREIQNMEYGIRNTEPSPKGRSGCGFSFDRFVHTSHPPIGIQNAEFKIYRCLGHGFQECGFRFMPPIHTSRADLVPSKI